MDGPVDGPLAGPMKAAVACTWEACILGRMHLGSHAYGSHASWVACIWAGHVPAPSAWAMTKLECP